MPKKSWPPNTRLNRGYIEFRKQYRGESIFRQWTEAKKEEAFSKIYEILRRIERREKVSENGERRLTVPQVCDIFWDLYASKSQYKAYPSMLARIKQTFYGRFFDTLDDEDIRQFIQWLKVTKFSQERLKNTKPYHLSISSINKHHACMTTIFRKVRYWLEIEKIVPMKMPKQLNPSSLVQKDIAHETVRRRVLSKEEAERLHTNAHLSVKKIIEAELFTTLRKSDLKNLRQQLEQAERDRITGVHGKTQVRFEMATNEHWNYVDLNWTNFRRRLDEAVKAAHIKNFQFRDLRRTGATWLYRESGNDLRLVQLRLGHKSPEMTKRYLGIMDDDNVRASQILGSIVSGFGEKVGEKIQEKFQGVRIEGLNFSSTNQHEM